MRKSIVLNIRLRIYCMFWHGKRVVFPSQSGSEVIKKLFHSGAIASGKL